QEELAAAATSLMMAADNTAAAGGLRFVGAIQNPRTVGMNDAAAIASYVAPIAANIDQLKTTVAAKADANAVTVLEASVSTKLVGLVDRASLDNALAVKANAADLTTFRETITTQIAAKADVAALTAT